MKKFLSLVLTLFVSGVVFAAQPQENKENSMFEPSHHNQQKMKQEFDKIAKELNITEEQKQKMNEMMKADMSKKRELRQQIREKMDAVDEELMKETIDMNEINKLAAEIQQINAEISKINIESKLKVRSVLSFEQYTKMEQNRKQMMGKFKRDMSDKQDNSYKDKKAQDVKKQKK